MLVAVGGQGGGGQGEGRMAHIGDRLRSLIVLLSRGWGGRRLGSGIAAAPPASMCIYVYMCVFMPEILDINSDFIGGVAAEREGVAVQGQYDHRKLFLSGLK